MSIFSRLFSRTPPSPPPPPPPASEIAQDDDLLVAVPIPPLVTLLISLEEQKGAPLTEEEVADARDRAVCMTLPLSRARALAEARGFPDLDPENAWTEWEAYRNGGPANR